MGLFGFLKDKSKEQADAVTFPAALGAAARGTVVSMQDIPDEVFSQGVLGICCGIDPSEGKIYAPIDGKISQLADTLHAVGIEAGGMEILLHVGVDTVDMGGGGFTSKVRLNQTVRKGDLLLTVDLDKVREAGHLTTVIMAVTNSDDFASVTETASGAVNPGEDVLKVEQ